MSSVQEKRDLKPVRLTMPKVPEPHSISAQKLTRLKVNRVAIIQVLRVEHILDYLVDAHVFTDEEKALIQSCRTTQDKARKLVDLLPKRQEHVDWYGHFRFALKNPEVRSSDVKKRYQILVEFLDNTIIKYPGRDRISKVDKGVTDKADIIKYAPLPSIDDSNPGTISPTKTNPGSRVTFNLGTSSQMSETDSEKSSGETYTINSPVTEDLPEVFNTKSRNSQDLTADYNPATDSEYSAWTPQVDIQNFSSLIDIPIHHLGQLEASNLPEDAILHEQELKVLDIMKRVEVAYAKQLREELSSEIFLSEAVESMLANSNHYHLFHKYLNYFRENLHMHIMEDVASSFCKYLSQHDDARAWPLVLTGFRVVRFLFGYGLYIDAEATLNVLITYLRSNLELENWIGLYEAYVLQMKIHNVNIEFKYADSSYINIEEMAKKIKTMSFGQDFLDESAANVQQSFLMQERGSIKPGRTLALKALQETDQQNHEDVVEALCNATTAYTLDYNPRKAEKVAVQAVIQARSHFGIHHPLYVKALLSFCHYCNEFQQQDINIQVARKAVEIAQTIFQTKSLLVAESYRAVACALMCNQVVDTEEYFQKALAACTSAMEVIGREHPALAPFYYTLAMALYWRSLHGNRDQSTEYIQEAETLALKTLQTYTSKWGMFSLKVGRTYVLLGLIYFRMKRFEESEKMLMDAIDLYQVSVTHTSCYTLFAKSMLAIVFKVLGKQEQAITFATEVLAGTENTTFYLNWVKTTFDLIIELFEATGNNVDSSMYKDKLLKWQNQYQTTKTILTWEIFHPETDSFGEFLQEFDLWKKCISSVKKGFDSLIQNKLA